ncbi:MAG: hypothetical protein HWD57_17880 [Candidatus Accumulibacter cognatus]|uniref:VWA domain-containing protein n=1 Tax=Candidatus Accumulibacter cognatus TaxID=2954383 RepID=A0A7D5NC90_9PROT|nr:MAG: hypothetical protein HWD57_17880 [Candidatus Accumulibacter cognatus]
MNSKARFLILVALFRICLPSAAVAAPAPALQGAESCYPKEIPAPRIASQTLIVVDRTTWPDAIAKRDFMAAVQSLVERGSQRVVVLSFAGIASGESLARDLDIRVEPPITDGEVINNSRIGPFKRSQSCVAQRRYASVEATRSTLDKLLVPPGPELARSEIAWALSNTIREFVDPRLDTWLLVFSDGLQFGSGQNFYWRKPGGGTGPRRIDPDAEMKRLPTGLYGSDGKGGTRIRLRWWGLLATPSRPGSQQYADADMLHRYDLYWRKVLTGWRITVEGIGPTINNPLFD